MAKAKKIPMSLFGKQIRTNPKAHELMIALNMVGLQANMQSCELILRAQSALKTMGGKFDLKTAAEIKVEVSDFYDKLESDFNDKKIKT
jgi:hypothetical protein